MTRVLLADDHTVVRQGVSALLRAEPDISVIGEASTGSGAVQMARRLKPDVVVMDVVMPGLNGLEATRRILKFTPSCRVLMLSSYTDDAYVLASTEAGAVGYVLKQTGAMDLVNAIREASKGNAFLSPAISKRLMERYRETVTQGPGAATTVPRLTLRENQVLRLIAKGRANKQIADDLQLSIKTVQRHRQKLMNKLHIHNIAGLTRYAVDKGISGDDTNLDA